MFGVVLEPLHLGKLSMLVAALQPLAVEASARLSLGLTLGLFSYVLFCRTRIILAL